MRYGRSWTILDGNIHPKRLTVRALKKLIKDTVLEVIDPDYGFELRPEVEKEFRLKE